MDNSKIKLIIAGGILLPFLIGGCGNSQGKDEKINGAEEAADIQTEQQTRQSDLSLAMTEDNFSFLDDLGYEVTVNNPRRAAALIGSFADIWLLAGGEVCAAANDSWESLQLPLGEETVNLGSIMEPDVEKLIASEPDLVLASANTEGNLALKDMLDTAGIPVAYFDVSHFEDYLHMLDICTQLTGRRDLYEENGVKVSRQVEKAKERADGSEPSVLFLRASASDVKAKGSKGTVGGEMLADLGCRNIADSNEGILDNLSMEAIIAENPAYIFVTTHGNDQEAAMEVVEEMFRSDPAWASLAAVKNRNYYVLDKRLFNIKPNADWGKAYEQLADILYPDNGTKK